LGWRREWATGSPPPEPADACELLLSKPRSLLQPVQHLVEPSQSDDTRASRRSIPLVVLHDTERESSP